MRLTLISCYFRYSLQPILPVLPYEPVVPADHDGKPMEPHAIRLEINYREPKLPVRVAHITLPPGAHREILDPQKDAAIHGSPRMSAETVRVTLKQADAFLL